MRVDIKDVEQRLKESFRVNPAFNDNNIRIDNTVEDKIFSFVLKLEEYFNFNLDSFYEKLKTLKLEPLSIYSNSGVVSYDASDNIGKISISVLNQDEENKYNVDNIFTQIMLMTSTSKDNYYGFGSVRELDALNKACTYMIASNLVGSSEENDLEEVLMILYMLDNILAGIKSRIDVVTSYLSNNGPILKKELNNIGINDDILNKINYLHEAIQNGLYIPDMYANIIKEVDNIFAKLVYNSTITDKDVIDRHISLLISNNVRNSSIGLNEERFRMTEFFNRFAKTNNNIVNINDYTKLNVMQKAA